MKKGLRKRGLFVVLMVLLFACLCPGIWAQEARAAEVTSGQCGAGASWKFSQDGVLTISGTGAIADYSETLSPWRKYDFENEIQKIVIQQGISDIGKAAFFGCGSLKEAAIPEGVVNIGEQVFSNCKKLEKVTIPNSVINIGFGVFYQCPMLKTAGKTGGNYNIEFSWTKEIPEHAFAGLESLESVTIPEGMASIKNDVFFGCENLEKVIILEGLTEIEDRAFFECGNLEKLIIPGSLTSIGANAFDKCPKLKTAGKTGGNYNIELGWTKEIPEYVLDNFTSLESVAIPEGVVSIGENYFSLLENLKKVIIPKSATSISADIFSECPKLKTAGKIGGNYNIEFGWTKEIPENAFSYCESLERVIIPEGVTRIGKHAFSNCSSLLEITIPKGMENIAEGAFMDCKNLKDLILPESVTSIGEIAFSDCTSMKKITILSKRCVIADAGIDFRITIFGYQGSTAEIYAKEHYRTFVVLQGSKDNHGSVKKGTKLTDFGANAFYIITKPNSAVAYVGAEDKKTGSVTVPPSVEIGGVSYRVTSIAANTFKNNKRLRRVTVTGNVETIGAGAFQNCTALTTVKLGGKVRVIGDKAFYGCKKISSLTMGKMTTGIGTSAFENCTAVKKIVVPVNVKKIGRRAFYNCRKLTLFTIQSKKLTAKNTGEKAFTKAGSGNYKKLTVKVPKGKLAAYKKFLNKKGVSQKAKIK